MEQKVYIQYLTIPNPPPPSKKKEKRKKNGVYSLKKKKLKALLLNLFFKSLSQIITYKIYQKYNLLEKNLLEL